MSTPWSCWEDVENCRRQYYGLLPLMEAAYAATNPVAIKAMIRLLGFPVGHCRPPLPDPQPKVFAAMKQVIERFELKKLYGLG
jgi:4-hydroxy-tetrahydrodipicolinate synthase